ncbi:hypothetical protein [Bacillus sp. Marseille-Q1617]|uniref:hypothetical protein n=1 Tax=Bacillus sp. Marseille-Q1617 TaxID=2736887 RepID=UPI00158883CA|nr:hypothetical protein [Bacillus sp. Marseille-Q1617]
MKKLKMPKVLLIIIVSTAISTLLMNIIEKRDLLSTKDNLESHLEEFKTVNKNKVSVVLKRKIGDQYVLLYTTKSLDEKIGIAYYIKTDSFPLYELVRDEEANHGLLGSSYLNNQRFIVYGNVRDSGADHFQYRNQIDFKKVKLGKGPYFIQVENYQRQLAVPLVTFYNNKGEELATAPAK